MAIFPDCGTWRQVWRRVGHLGGMSTNTTSPRRILLDQKTTGVRKILWTNHTVSATLVREQMHGRVVRWIVTTGICNGVADKAEEFKTLRDAEWAFGGC